jgi:hypothetical protein
MQDAQSYAPPDLCGDDWRVETVHSQRVGPRDLVWISWHLSILLRVKRKPEFLGGFLGFG